MGKMIGPEVGVAGTRVFGGFPRVQGVELVAPSLRNPAPPPRKLNLAAALQVSSRVERVNSPFLSRRPSQLEDW